MLDDDAIEATGELAEMLAASDAEDAAAAAARPWIDPLTADVRFTNLKEMEKSPAHYVEAVQQNRDETLSMRIGSGTHAMLLGEPWIVYPGKRVKGRAKKDGSVTPSAWDRFAEEHADKAILSQTEADISKRMVDAILAHADAVRVLLTDTIKEHKLGWTLHGRRASSTPDAYGPTHYSELKTTRCADSRLRGERDSLFARQAKALYYHCQAAMYGQAVAENEVCTAESAYIVAVENTRPHVVTVMKWTNSALAIGDRTVHLWMERLNGCLRSNVWPGYVQAIADLDFLEDGWGTTY